MPDKPQQKHRRQIEVNFKSLHKPLTYLGVERTLFYFVCVGAVGNLLQSLQFHPRRDCGLRWRLCLRPLGHEQRCGFSPYPRKVRTLQAAL